MKANKSVSMSADNFAVLCVCAIRYCQGRQTYMPDLVRSIVKAKIDYIDDTQLQVMLDDCKFQRQFDLYGDERIDKPGWLAWEEFLVSELNRRGVEHGQV